MCLCGIIMTPLMLISSAMATMRDTPKALHWLFECNLVENSIKGSLLAVFGYNRSKLLCEESSIYCHFKYPQAILKEFDVSMSIERTLIVLVAYSIAFRFLAYWILKYRLKLKMWKKLENKYLLDRIISRISNLILQATNENNFFY